MSGGAGRESLTWAAAAFIVLFPVIQEVGFRLVVRRVSARPEDTARGVLVWVLARLVVVACGCFAAPAAVWWWRARGLSLGAVLAGVELFLVFGVFAAGLTLVSVRLAVGFEGRGFRAGRLLVRVIPWLAGSAYALAVARYARGGTGGTLLSVFLLGAALAALGVNHASKVSREELRRLR